VATAVDARLNSQAATAGKSCPAATPSESDKRAGRGEFAFHAPKTPLGTHEPVIKTKSYYNNQTLYTG